MAVIAVAAVHEAIVPIQAAAHPVVIQALEAAEEVVFHLADHPEEATAAAAEAVGEICGLKRFDPKAFGFEQAFDTCAFD